MLTYVNEYRMAQSIYILYGDSRTWLETITKAQVRLYETLTNDKKDYDARSGAYNIT